MNNIQYCLRNKLFSVIYYNFVKNKLTNSTNDIFNE